MLESSASRLWRAWKESKMKKNATKLVFEKDKFFLKLSDQVVYEF